MTVDWGLVLFVPLSGIVAAIYLAIVLGRRGAIAPAPAVTGAGWPVGMRVAIFIVGSVLVLILASLIVVLAAGPRQAGG